MRFFRKNKVHHSSDVQKGKVLLFFCLLFNFFYLKALRSKHTQENFPRTRTNSFVVWKRCSRETKIQEKSANVKYTWHKNASVPRKWNHKCFKLESDKGRLEKSQFYFGLSQFLALEELRSALGAPPLDLEFIYLVFGKITGPIF